MSPIHILLESAAAFVAGCLNSLAGGGILITLATLVHLGIDPKVANATSTVALWPGLLGAMWGYRHEMPNRRSLVVKLSIPCLIGGALGGALLILTPSKSFARSVPYLILFATALFALHEPIRRSFRIQKEEGALTIRWWTIGMLLLSGTYGGYFGAGNGILMLATLHLIGLNKIHEANGIKTLLCLALNVTAVGGFALFHLINWPVAILMAVGASLGGYATASLATRLDSAFARRSVIVIGLLLSVVMLFRFGKG